MDSYDVFDKYARFGKTEIQIKGMREIRIEERQIQHMMKDANVIDSEYSSQALDNDMSRLIGQLKQSDPDKYPKGIKTFEHDGFEELLRLIAHAKSTLYRTLLKKISKVAPTWNHTTMPVNDDIMSRMTDVTKYTGMHKERFDMATGKGKGLEGRTYRAEDTGYVANYKLNGTYDKRHSF